MAIQRVLEMDFATELNRTHRMRVYDAREAVSAAEIAAAMDTVVAKNIFNGSGGELTGKIAARIVTKETEDISLV
ncbi:DUF2922 domain-containing protein [Syntrophomonas curvata]